jgi:hypothetical protein
MVFLGFYGKKDLLDALYRPGAHHGRSSAALVEPCADSASAGGVLVGGLQERMVQLVEEWLRIDGPKIDGRELMEENWWKSGPSGPRRG